MQDQYAWEDNAKLTEVIEVKFQEKKAEVSDWAVQMQIDLLSETEKYQNTPIY